YFNYYFSSFLFLLPNKKNAPNAASKDPNNVVFTISDSPVLGKAFLFSFCLDFSSAFPLLSFFIISLLFVCFIADILDCFSGILDVILVVFLASFIGMSFTLLLHSFSSDFSSDFVAIGFSSTFITGSDGVGFSSGFITGSDGISFSSGFVAGSVGIGFPSGFIAGSDGIGFSSGFIA